MKKNLDKMIKLIVVALIAGFVFVACVPELPSVLDPLGITSSGSSGGSGGGGVTFTANLGNLAATLWDEKNAPLTIDPNSEGDTFIGWKDYGNKGTDGEALNVSGRSEKAGTISDATYTAEYSSTEKILDRTVSLTGVYADATASKWDTISSWSLADLKTEFGK